MRACGEGLRVQASEWPHGNGIGLSSAFAWQGLSLPLGLAGPVTRLPVLAADRIEEVRAHSRVWFIAEKRISIACWAC